MKRIEAIKLTDEAFQDIDKQKWTQAKNKLEKVLEKFQDIPDTHSEYSLVMSHFGDEKKAKHHINLAFDCASDDPKFVSNLSAYYFRKNAFEKAETLVGEAIERYPNYSAFYLAKVHILQALCAEPKEVYDVREKAIAIYKKKGNRSDGVPFSKEDFENYFTLTDGEKYDTNKLNLTPTSDAFLFQESSGNHSFVLPRFEEWRGRIPFFGKAKFVLKRRNSKSKIVITRQFQDQGGYKPQNNDDLAELAFLYTDEIGCQCIYAAECLYFPKLLPDKELPVITFAYYHTNLKYYAKKIVFFSQTSDEWTFTIRNYTRKELTEFHQLIKAIKPFSDFKGKNNAFQRVKIIS